MPNAGETVVIGRLHSMGYHINRQRVRESIRRTDPLNTPLRWRGIAATRRPYSVPAPNSLWHVGTLYQCVVCVLMCVYLYKFCLSLDGHHKLIRWGLVTHGGIDGFSRLVVYLRCSNNNRSATVYNSFLSAAAQYGLPSRVRSDQGRENYLIAAHMLEHRGRSMITAWQFGA